MTPENSITTSSSLFDRVVSIIETSRSNAIRSVDAHAVHAYWHIGREIVEDIQQGESRADYGKNIISNLSKQLNARYGQGYSVTNLQDYRKFYLTEFQTLRKQRPLGVESAPTKQHPSGVKYVLPDTSLSPLDPSPPEFHPQLSWSHYRALMRIENPEARAFYEEEAIEGAWDKRTLERNIHSQVYERRLKTQQPKAKNKASRVSILTPDLGVETLKSPYILEFLGLPHNSALYENKLESAIITHLQSFLLELGKGFAFVARQKRMRYEDQDFFVDLVFYNCILKCYLLIDLKVGALSHQDVGQMDSYVRMFEDLHTAEDDNPTIGLILCTEKNEAIAKYSVLSERKQVFASKYMLYLPSEEELSLEIARERKLIEEHIRERNLDNGI